MNARPTWCFDFDGTLVDYSEAAQHAYQFAADSLGTTVLPDYWEQRRAGVTDRELALRSGVPARAYARYEAIRHQVLDEEADAGGCAVLPGALALLRHLVEDVHVWIVSHRPCVVRLMRQAQRCGIAPFVTEYHCTRIGSAPGRGSHAVTAAKEAVLKRARRPVAMVGDSTSDVLAARRAGVMSVAVPTGCTSEARLRRAHPTYIYASLDELLTLVQRDGRRGWMRLPAVTPSYGNGCLDRGVDDSYAAPAIAR
jgi:phosphoglycolate phosphatase-like HAD superfamily hydrolase